VDFRLLGPVEVRTSSAAVPIGGTKPRTLLTALLLQAGQVVPTERLIDLIWEDSPPKTARGLVQTYVSGLRRAGGDALADVIVSHPLGYLTRVPDTCLDWVQFEQLAAQGRSAASAGNHQAAAEVFRAADALWRGPALGGVSSRALAAEATRLEELRTTLIEERVTEELALGCHDTLIGELPILVGQHPTRERLRGQLMRALYQAGRPSEALAVFRQGRAALIDELGVEPGPELTHLHAAILRSDPGLAAPTVPGNTAIRLTGAGTAGHQQPQPAGAGAAGITMSADGTDGAGRSGAGTHGPAQLPPAPREFIGRAAHVDRLVSWLSESGSTPPVCVISGLGGVGKSALAVHVAHRLTGLYPDGQVHVDLRGISDTPAPPVEVLGRLLRAFDQTQASLPESVDVRMDLYRTLVAHRRILLLLDDAADERQVRPLLPGGARCAVIITARNRLAGLTDAHLVELDMLTPDEATTLLGRVAGEERIDAASGPAALIVERCGYLPLAVRIAGARLAARRWSPQLLADRLADEQRRLDELRVGDQQIRATIEVSFRSLDRLAQTALRRLGDLGSVDLPGWIVAVVLDTSPAEADAVIEQLIDAYLVDYRYADTGGQIRYRLHDLVRIYASERAEPHDDRAEVTAATSRVIAGWQWLVDRIAAATPGDTMRHLPEPATSTRIDAAVVDAVLSDPRSWLAAEQEGLILAVERAAAAGLDDQAVELASALCCSLYPTYNLLDSWERTHRTALASARRSGNTHGEAILRAEVGQLRYEQDRFDEAREHLAGALTMFHAAGQSRGEASTLIMLGATCRDQGYLPQAQGFLDQATALCRTLGDDSATGHCARIAGSVLLETGDFPAAAAALDEALTAYQRIGSRRGEALTLRTIGLLHRATGRLAAAERACDEALGVFRDIGDELLEAYCLRALAKTRLRSGAGDQALPMLRAALTTCVAAGDRWGQGITVRTIGELHLAAGRLDEARHDLVSTMPIWAALGVPLWEARTLRDLAMVHEALGEAEQAQRARATALATFLARGAREYAELTARVPGQRDHRGSGHGTMVVDPYFATRAPDSSAQ
jgi:DNA-binding SARP family transcriptional activator/tetratricopeptide (TPR) repeat protein